MGLRVWGTGAVIRNGTPDRPLTIGDDVVIGAGACVVVDVPAGTTVAGVPAAPK
jgi:serine acetyltransferase